MQVLVIDYRNLSHIEVDLQINHDTDPHNAICEALINERCELLSVETCEPDDAPDFVLIQMDGYGLTFLGRYKVRTRTWDDDDGGERSGDSD